MKAQRTLNYEQALHRTAALCSRGEQCEYDINSKLLAWGLSEDDCRKLIRYLTKEKYLDNERYAIAFVKDKTRFAKWGAKKIAYTLRSKRINEEIIAKSLKIIDNEENQETLVKLLQAKAKNIKYKDSYDRRVKLIRFALSRGFRLRDIEKVLAMVIVD